MCDDPMMAKQDLSFIVKLKKFMLLTIILKQMFHL